MKLVLLVFYGSVFVFMGVIAALWILRMIRSALSGNTAEKNDED